MIRAVIFDIDGTLYDYESANKEAMKAVSEYAAAQFGWEAARFPAENKAMMKVLGGLLNGTAASHNRLIRYQNILEKHSLPLHPHALKMHALYWDTLLRRMRMSPGADRVMEELRKRGVRIGIGTDMTARIQFVKLERLGLLPLVDFLVTSEEAGAEKPDGKLFRRCAEKADAAPAECLFVGDSPEKDYRGAKATGMQALWFRPEDKAAAADPDRDAVVPAGERIASLEEILELIPPLPSGNLLPGSRDHIPGSDRS